MSELAAAQATTEEKQELLFYLGVVARRMGKLLEQNPFNVIEHRDQWKQWREGWRHARDQKL